MQQFQSVTTNSQKQSKEKFKNIQRPSSRLTATDDQQKGQNFDFSILAIIDSDIKLNKALF